MAKRRFKSENSARNFAKKVNGEFKDLREIKGSISDFVVTYIGGKKSKKEKPFKDDLSDWCPEEDRDFGYPNEYWN